ncbi:helicase-exonuclease AddAB subunit AddB [Terrilactibacillus laevilacticus]|uniref:ATP-dependent helicase/deoxyribonuclease subunit B n=1 Tax=Terrilactibacillus laevilacticus TaxID=1380157 RepID=A0ABW5PQK2_9BACI|nr:helicase-exonuclease AddAB subunit AddB [Terrilactibacillus laevilacticus]
MSLRCILGSPGTGKTTYCHEEIIKKLKENPMGKPLVLLVPEQMTFSTEYSLAKTPDLGGMTRLNVYSFPRLALRVLQQSGGAARYHLTSVGVSMLLRKIVEQHKGKLRLYKKAADQHGFFDQLHTAITEFKRYCISPQELHDKAVGFVSEDQNDVLLQDKLADLQLIYSELEKAILDKFIDSEDYLQLLIDKIKETPFLKDTEVWIDGFDVMTPQERQVVAELMVHTKRTTVTLNLDQEYELLPHPLSVYQQPARLYKQIKEHALDLKVEIESNVYLTEYRRSQKSGLRHLALQYNERPYLPNTDHDGITLLEATNRREEIELAARRILTFVRDEGIRYRDISVFVRDLSSYSEMIRTIFGDYKIPIFIDQKRSMCHHPLIEFIRSALEVIQKNWRYDAVFRCVKTDMLFSYEGNRFEQREEMDILENYVIAHGIYGKKWTNRDPWLYQRYQDLDRDIPKTKEDVEAEKRLNRIRFQVARPLQSLQEQMKKAPTIKDKCVALYEFLMDLFVPEKIERLRKEAETEGRLEDAMEHRQVWKAVMDLMDQMVEATGEERVSLSLFNKMIETGLDTLEFALVPPAIDQVVIGSLDRSRPINIKVAFILGINEGILPAKPTEEGILSDQDRVLLQSEDVILSEGTDEQMMNEEYYLFRGLTCPSDELILSYPLANEEGKGLLPSPFIHRLKHLFPTLTEKLIHSEPQSVLDEDHLPFVTRPNKTLAYLASGLREWLRGYPLQNVWWNTYNWYMETPDWKDKCRHMIASLFYRNQASIKPETAKQLYGETIKASVSRMELFNACPFAQFASYGLKLRERSMFRLEAPDIGQLFHSALRMMTNQLMQKHKSWADLTEKACEQLAEDVVTTLAPKLQRQILMSSNRHHYLQHKLSQVVARVAKVMSSHAKRSGFSPIGLELPFGPNQPLPPLTFELPNGCKMEIVGRIDRVDRGTNDQGVLLRIIDYKSSSKDLSMTEVYYGLALQMLTYLDVIITNAKAWLGEEAMPAGVLYFHVHDPLLSINEPLTDEAIEKTILKDFKMKGLVLSEESVVREMDTTLTTGYSDLLPLALKKNGEFYSSSSVASIEAFDAMKSHVREVIQKVGTDLTSGQVDISPYRLNDRTPCDFCSFRSVCQFDQSQKDNNYRLLKKQKDEEMMKQLLKGDSHE